MVTLELEGLKQTLGFMDGLKQGVRGKIQKEMNRQAIALQRRVVEFYLQGPRPMHLSVKTGNLQRHIPFRVTEPTEGSFVGKVGTAVKYGVMWELGFDRKIGAGARGGPKTLKGAEAIASYFEKHPPGIRYLRRPFLNPALQDQTPLIKEGLKRALDEALR